MPPNKVPELKTKPNKKAFRLPALIVAVLLFGILCNVPIFDSISARYALALLVLAAVLWITEAIPLALTGLLIPVLAIVTRLAEPARAFQPFAHPIIFLFMGGFALAGALSHHGVDKWLAQRLINLARGNFYRSAVLLMLATALMACWVTNTSAAAMMIPLAVGMLVLVGKNQVSAESKFLMLGIAYAANIGGVITMVASPPNAMGAAIMGLSFSQWTAVSLPLFLVAFPAMVALLTVYFKPDRQMSIDQILPSATAMAPNKTLIGIFLVIVALWVSDSMLSPWLGLADSFSSVVALLAIFLLFVTGTMTWEGILQSIRWEVLLLFGGGLTLGMVIDSSGLGALVIGQLAGLMAQVPLWLFLWIIVLFSIVLTEFMSNTASAALILPLLYTMAIQLHLNPMLLVFPATIAASFGFMMPVGTPPNAMVFASGLVPRASMLKVGLLMNAIASVIVTAFFYLVFG
jgi:solute carrier family 13 (sodium-dependent dicarboxylate transporter), member 2/3/5